MLLSQACHVDVDVVQLESNTPGEDRFCVRERIYRPGTGNETVGSNTIDRAYVVIDGHGGFLAADMTREWCLILHI